MRNTLLLSLIGTATLVIIAVMTFHPKYNTNTIPKISIPSLSGKFIHIPDPKQRPTWVNIWSITCASCLQELPEMQAFYDEFSEQVNFATLALPQDPPNLILRLRQEKQLSFPIGLDIHNEFVPLFGQAITPSHHLVNADGAILYSHYGAMTREDIHKIIQSSL